MATRFKSIALKVGIGLLTIAVLVTVVFVTAFFWMADPLETGAPSDSALLKLFHDRHMEFEQLRNMANKDSFRESYFSLATLDNNKLSKARQKQWRDILGKLNPKMVVSTDYGGVVRCIFAVGAVSAIGPGWSKGITYIPDHQERFGIPTSDLKDASTKPADTYLRSIEPKWFCYYQRDE